MLYTSYRSTTRGRQSIQYGRWFVDNVAELMVSCFLLSLADAATTSLHAARHVLGAGTLAIVESN